MLFVLCVCFRALFECFPDEKLTGIVDGASAHLVVGARDLEHALESQGRRQLLGTERPRQLDVVRAVDLARARAAPLHLRAPHVRRDAEQPQRRPRVQAPGAAVNLYGGAGLVAGSRAGAGARAKNRARNWAGGRAGGGSDPPT